MTLLFEGGDTEYVSTAFGNTEKYNKWLERLSDFSEIIETRTKNITNLFSLDNFPSDEQIT
jgi:hypothetical protein